jgi:hypothetical protein
VPNAKLVAMCMSYGGAYRRRPATWDTGASAKHAAVRGSQMGSHSRFDVRNVQAVTGT